MQDVAQATRATQKPSNKPITRGVHHLVFCTDDMQKTVDFYVDVLGAPLIHAMKVPPGLGTGPNNRGNPPYEEIRHYFFDMGRDGLLAFFEMPRGAKEEDGFVYMSDPFIRHMVGPQLKLSERRRMLCYNHLRMIGHAALLYRSEHGPCRLHSAGHPDGEHAPESALHLARGDCMLRMRRQSRVEYCPERGVTLQALGNRHRGR